MISSPLLTALERDEEFLASVLRSTCGEPHIRIDRIEILRRSQDTQDLSDSVTRVVVSGRKGKQLNEFSKTLLIKRHPEHSSRHPAQRDPAFCNEAVVYSRVLPSLLQCGEGDCEPLLRTPICLHASTSVIVLEDMVSLGFTTGNRVKGLDFDHAAAALQALGRFHAVSLSLKHQDKSAFDRVTSQVQEVVFVPEAAPVFGASLESALELAISSLKKCPEMVIFEAVQMLQSLRGRTFRTLVSLAAPREPLSVICHGDFWINNIMFSYKNDKIDDVVLTDLQVVRYSSLANDILHFLHTSLEPGLSREYSEDLIKVYHKSLSETMKKIAPSSPTVTLEEILDEIESHALYGLLMSFLVLPSITDSAKDSQGRTDFYCDSFSLMYSQRVKSLVLEFVEKGFI
ncbi:uncharacterized protein LOC128991981 isoform X2 [Macrosteles quadrilineatus]|nr:uncharacterized protein LOC128991981 isoform X2 [Macrosteles quadrilineatus]XP_054271277.1 uncharacterized protein LOC128991981 isoform X2 [Macrosteles quadrilineatus]XP_054271278.1 uncharacterized protein LOC128991981 isoform X2 [Macrosteles quadrilineatus]